MLNALKYFKTYGVPKERFANYKEIIQEGNDISLGVIVVINALILAIYTAVTYIQGWDLSATPVFTIVEVLIAMAWFLLAKYTKGYHYWFFYASVEVIMVYGAYAMSIDSVGTIFLYPAIVVLMPLFYMHNMVASLLFYGLNYALFCILAGAGPEWCRYMQEYVPVAGFFTLIGLIIHFVYQSNRLRELINYQDSLEKQGALEISSSFDQLSKLLRRRAFVRISENQIRNKLENKFMMLGIMDIDHFKLINDTYGHQLGDETISVIGNVLANEMDIVLVAPDDITGFELDYEYDYGNICGRLGGDEFIFLIKSVVDIDDGLRLMNNVIDRVNRTSFANIRSIHGSIGVVTIDSNDATFDELYHKADCALYEAKNGGRNRCVVYKEGMKTSESSSKSGLDALTGLLDEKTFKERATDEINSINKNLYVINIDVENFKSYNAKYGFDKGDELLISVAKALGRVFDNGFISRFTGDHFVVLTENPDLSRAIIDLKGIVNENLPDYANVLRVGAYEIKKDNIVDINLACDNAKFACDVLRGRYDKLLQMFDEELETKRDKFQYVVEHIDDAIENEWIKLFFQPVIDVQTKKVFSMEALARWESEEYGMLPPFDFIDTLEQTRLIHKLDSYMLEKICQGYVKAKEFAKRDFVSISVNLSQRDFEIVDDIVGMVEETVSKYNMPRYLLHLEITESTLTEQKEHLQNVALQFEELGYEIWMDDFGSGYSSLNVLKDFRFDTIKFDMGFLRGNVVSSKIILKHMIDMCKELGLKTLVEGVETEEQFEFLKSLGCDYCQGYLFSKPLPADEIIEYLEKEVLDEPLKEVPRERV